MTIQRETNSKHLFVVDLEVTYNIGFPIEDDTVTLRCNENALLSVTQLVAVLIYNSCSSVFCNNFGPVKFHLFIITHTQSNTRREKNWCNKLVSNNPSTPHHIALSSDLIIILTSHHAIHHRSLTQHGYVF